MAFGDKTIAYGAGAVSDIFGGQTSATALRLKAQGSDVEGVNYDAAAILADENAKFTEASTAVKTSMAERSLYLGIGAIQSDIAGANFANSGSALDILRASTAQGALQKALIGEQGEITEAGYTEQAQSYRNLSAYAKMAAETERSMADSTSSNSFITGGLKAAAAVFSIFG